MKRKNQRAGTACLNADIALLSDGTPPTEFRIFRAGVNESDYGPITFDAKAADMVLAADREKGNPLYFDWNHGMAQKGASRAQGAAAGTFQLAVRPTADGPELWAVACGWTDEGAEDIAKRRYNLFSPAFLFARDERGVTRPTQLINCALVNLAGLDHLQPIAASADLEGEETMNEAEIQALKSRAEKAEAELATLKAQQASGGMMLGAALGLGTNVSEEGRIEAAKSLAKTRGDVLALTGQATESAALGVLTAWKGSHERVAALSAEVETRAQADRETRFTATLDQALTETKISQAEKPFWEGQCKEGGKVTEKGLALLSAYVATAQPRLATSEIPQPQGAGAAVAVGEAKMNKLMNVDPVAFAKFQAEQRALGR